jgi:diacylglycerol kinase (ATP)
MRSKLIVNPVSGRDAAPDYLVTINQALRERVGTLDIVMTIAEGDATRLATQAVDEGVDHLFICGGDGTLNEALNGVAVVPGALETMTFGIIPLGTGNDFATALGLPEAAEAAVAQLLDVSATRVDVGRLNDRYFINVSAGGFIAEVSEAVNPQLKTIAGKLAYLLGGAQVVLTYAPMQAQIRMPDGTASLSLNTFAVCNSRLVGGGHLIAPRAVVDDGLLDVCLIEAMSTVDFIALLRQVSGGKHLDDERVTYRQTREIELTFDRRIAVNTDGQVLEADHCRYTILPKAARFLGYAGGHGAHNEGT